MTKVKRNEPAIPYIAMRGFFSFLTFKFNPKERLFCLADRESDLVEFWLYFFIINMSLFRYTVETAIKNEKILKYW